MFREKSMLRLTGKQFVKGYMFQYQSIIGKPTTYKVVGRRGEYVEMVKTNFVERWLNALKVRYNESVKQKKSL